jgi:prevent-host-death family protein
LNWASEDLVMRQPRIGVRELKSRLGKYLRVAQAGEAVTITSRGMPIGRIVPVGPRLAERLAAMQAAGQAQWSGRKLGAARPVTKTRGRRTVADLLVADRD